METCAIESVRNSNQEHPNLSLPAPAWPIQGLKPDLCTAQEIDEGRFFHAFPPVNPRPSIAIPDRHELDTGSEIQPLHYEPTEPSRLRFAIMERSGKLEVLKGKTSVPATRKPGSPKKTFGTRQPRHQHNSVTKSLDASKSSMLTDISSIPSRKNSPPILISANTVGRLEKFRFENHLRIPEATKHDTEHIARKATHSPANAEGQQHHALISGHSVITQPEAVPKGGAQSKPATSLCKPVHDLAPLSCPISAINHDPNFLEEQDCFRYLASVEDDIEVSVSHSKMRDEAASFTQAVTDAESSWYLHTSKEKCAELVKAREESGATLNRYAATNNQISLIEVGGAASRLAKLGSFAQSRATDEEGSDLGAEYGIDWDSVSTQLTLMEAESGACKDYQSHQALTTTMTESPHFDSAQLSSSWLRNNTDLNSLDDSVFDQFADNDETDFQELPPSTEVHIDCLSSSPTRIPTNSSLMPPPSSSELPTLIGTISQAGNHMVEPTPGAAISPFIRRTTVILASLPSQIPGLNPKSRIPTCFRMVDIFRHLSSQSPPATIELFATITSSTLNLNHTSQSFIFADLFFPQRPPYLHGTISHCSGNELSDDDCSSFLNAGCRSHGVLTRAMVRTKPKSGEERQVVVSPLKDSHTSSLRSDVLAVSDLEVLSIRVCQWRDVDYTKGIVMSEEEEMIRKEGEKLNPTCLQDENRKKRKMQRRLMPLASVSRNTVKKRARASGVQLTTAL